MYPSTHVATINIDLSQPGSQVHDKTARQTFGSRLAWLSTLRRLVNTTTSASTCARVLYGLAVQVQYLSLLLGIFTAELHC